MGEETVTATPLPTMPSLMRAFRGPTGQEDIGGVGEPQRYRRRPGSSGGVGEKLRRACRRSIWGRKVARRGARMGVANGVPILLTYRLDNLRVEVELHVALARETVVRIAASTSRAL